MATVRFSKELRIAILDNVEKMFGPQKEAAEKSLNTALFQGVYSTVFAEYLPHMNALPESFFFKANALDIRVAPNANRVQVKLGGTLRVPAQNTHMPGLARYMSHYSTPDVVLDSDNPVWEPIRQEHTAWLERKAAIEKSCAELKDLVRKIMDTHTTLAPALKTWPPLWDFLPEEAKERHKAIKESKAAKEPIDCSELDKYTATVTLHKLRNR